MVLCVNQLAAIPPEALTGSDTLQLDGARTLKSRAARRTESFSTTLLYLPPFLSDSVREQMCMRVLRCPNTENRIT